MEDDPSIATGLVHAGAKNEVLPARREETGRKPVVA